MMVNVLTTLFLLTCIFLVLVILIQKPKGGGLSGAFGGAGGGGAVFGAKAGDALTWFTVGAFSCFLLLAIALVYATRDEPDEVLIDEPEPAVETVPVDPDAVPPEEDLLELDPEAAPEAPEAPAEPEQPVIPEPEADPQPQPEADADAEPAEPEQP